MSRNYVEVPGTWLVARRADVMAELAMRYAEKKEAHALKAYDSEDNIVRPGLWDRLFKGAKPYKLHTLQEIRDYLVDHQPFHEVDKLHAMWDNKRFANFLVLTTDVTRNWHRIRKILATAEDHTGHNYLIEVDVADEIATLADAYNKRVNKTTTATDNV